MAKNLYYNDNGTIRQLANLDSPAFTGTPKTDTVDGTNDFQLVNLEFLKTFINKQIEKTIIESTYTKGEVLKDLVAGSDYMISIYGLNTMTSVTGNKIIGYPVILSSTGEILGYSGRAGTIDWPDGYFPQSSTIRVTVPVDGYCYGFISYGSSGNANIPASYMSAIRLNDTFIKVNKLSISQSPNQTIKVKVNGITYTDDFTYVPNTHLTIEVEPEFGYLPGNISVTGSGYTNNGSDYVINGNSIISVSPAVELTDNVYIDDYKENDDDEPIIKQVYSMYSNSPSIVYNEEGWEANVHG